MVVVPTFEDALIATLVNFNLQAVVIRHGFPFHSVNHNHMLRRFLDGMDGKVEDMPEFERGPLLGRQIAQIRPELDLYLVTDVNVEAIAAQVGEVFKRIFFGEEDHIELYSSIMKAWASATARPSSTPCATMPSSPPACSMRCRWRAARRS